MKLKNIIFLKFNFSLLIFVNIKYYTKSLIRSNILNLRSTYGLICCLVIDLNKPFSAVYPTHRVSSTTMSNPGSMLVILSDLISSKLIPRPITITPPVAES